MSSKPQTLSQTWRIGQSQPTKSTSRISSITRARISNDSSQASDPAVAPRPGASSSSAAAAVDAPDARNSPPSHGLSAQIGRFVTVKRTPVYPATKNPSKPPSPATSLASIVPLRSGCAAGVRTRPSSVHAPISDSAAHNPNSMIAQAPNEIGDQPLNITFGKLSDWNSMCQKRKGLPRSMVSNAPEMTAPQKASE